MKRFATFIYFVLAANLATPVSAAGDGYPNRPIRLVVPATAGGGIDAATRTFGHKLSEALGQPVVVDNRPGANGYIAAEFVAKSPPDGYTILVGGNALVVGPLLSSSHKLNVGEVFTPIGSLMRVELVLVSSPTFPANNAREFFQLARDKKANLSYASTTPGIMMSTEQIKALAGIELLRVPYRGGPEAFVDVTTGRVSVMFDTIAAQLPYIKSGRAKPLAVNGTTRNLLLPDVPTIAESGVAGYEEDNYIGLLGPAGMDAHALERVNVAITKILKDPDFQATIDRMGFKPAPTSSKVYSELLTATAARYARVADRLGIKPE